MKAVGNSIIMMTYQKPWGLLINGMPIIVFMPKIAAMRLRGKIMTEKIVRVFII